MTQGQASPAVGSRGTRQEMRIVLTRTEIIQMLSRFVGFVKDKEPKDFPGWLDEIFAEAERDGAIVFDREAPAGRRFA